MDINSIIVGIQYHRGAKTLEKGNTVELSFNGEEHEYPTGIRVLNEDGVVIGNIIANMNHPSLNNDTIISNNIKNNNDIRKITTNNCKATVVSVKRYIVFITIHTSILVEEKEKDEEKGDTMDLKERIKELEESIEENKAKRRQLRKERVAMKKELKQLKEVENNTDEVVEETTDVKEEKGESMELRDVNVDTKCGNPQFAIGSDKIIGYDEVTICGNCGAKIEDNFKFCTKCGEKVREEVTSSQSTTDNGDEIIEKLMKVNTEFITKSVMKRKVPLMVVEMQQNELSEAFEKAKEEYITETVTCTTKYNKLHPIANILLTLRSIDDIVANKYLNGEVSGGEFDYVRVHIGIHSYFFYEHLIEKVDMDEFFSDASIKASEKFLKEEEEREYVCE